MEEEEGGTEGGRKWRREGGRGDGLIGDKTAERSRHANETTELRLYELYRCARVCAVTC